MQLTHLVPPLNVLGARLCGNDHLLELVLREAEAGRSLHRTTAHDYRKTLARPNRE
jgi:hypothetical protein